MFFQNESKFLTNSTVHLFAVMRFLMANFMYFRLQRFHSGLFFYCAAIWLCSCESAKSCQINKTKIIKIMEI